jgi:hypothetical protein
LRSIVVILALFVGSFAKGQDFEVFKGIDSIVTSVDSTASRGKMDTLKKGLLNEGGTTSDLLLLLQGRQVHKISVISKSRNYSEKIVFKDGKAVFAQFIQADGVKWTFYLVGENAFFKDRDKFNKGSRSYWNNMIDSYLNMFVDEADE